MADTGYNWAAHAYMQKSGGNWSADAITAAAYETGDEVSLDGKAACEIGLSVTANAVPSDPLTVLVLRNVGGSNFEALVDASMQFTFDLENGVAHYKGFSIDPAEFGSFKLALGGCDVACTVNSVYYRTATIPVAS